MLLTEDGDDKDGNCFTNWAGQAGNHDPKGSAIFKKHLLRAKSALSTPSTDYSMMGIQAVVNQYAIVYGDVPEKVETTHAYRALLLLLS
jgi:hypothetical protein